MVDLVSHEGGPMKKAFAQSIRCATLAAVLMIALGALPYSRSAFADQVPAGWEASNMQPVGYSDLNGHGAFKMAIKRVGDKWYLYMGHLWERGWTIVDVTDPANPKVAKHIPGPDNTFTIQMELHDNLMVTAMERMFPTWGGDVDKPFDEGVLVWDISDPLNPKQLSHWKTGGTGAHRIGYPGGKYVNVAAAMPGYKGNILVFLDISDPKNPKEVSRWWLRGQKEGEPSIVDSSLLAQSMWSIAPSISVADLFDIDGIPGAPPGLAMNPLVNRYKTRDGRFIQLVFLQPDRYWAGFCRRIGLADLATDPRFVPSSNLIANAADACALVGEALAGQDLEHWRKALADEPGVWAALATPKETLNDPQVEPNGYTIANVDDQGTEYQIVAAPVQFNETPPAPARAPEHGQHTEEILLELDLDWDDISAAKDSGAIL